MCADNRGEGLNIKELESLDYKPKAPCDDCGLTDGTHMRGCKYARVRKEPMNNVEESQSFVRTGKIEKIDGELVFIDDEIYDGEMVPIPGSCQECGVISGSHLKSCSQHRIHITAQHAHSLTALVRHWKKMIRYLGKENCELTAEYCDELLKDLEQ